MKHSVALTPVRDPSFPTLARLSSTDSLTRLATVAAHRASHNLPPLQIHVIDVISPSDARLDPANFDLMRKTKMSSTFIREWIYESKKKEGLSEGKQ
jgi:pantetheine-phosphate adenylyltransferase